MISEKTFNLASKTPSQKKGIAQEPTATRTVNLCLDLTTKKTKIVSFSLIERVILSAGAMLIFSVSFQIDQMPEGKHLILTTTYIPSGTLHILYFNDYI